MTTTAAPSSTFRELSMGLIDEPDLPTREKMDGEKLRELAASIAANGLIQPIAVEERGIRFVILAGHRRYVASKMNGAPTILARVYPAGCDRSIAIQAHENAFREKVNAAEEGDWLQELYVTRCGEDVTKLAALTGYEESYVCARLLLVQGDKEICEAVRGGAISMSVALELNRIDAADLRYYYLQSAKATGASVRQAKLWRSQAEQIIASRLGAPVDAPASDTPAAPAPAIVHVCVCCGGQHDVHEMEYVQVHRYCNKAILQPTMARHRGEKG